MRSERRLDRRHSAVGGKAAHGFAASPSELGRFETQWLAAPANLSALSDLSGQWIDIVHDRRPPRGVSPTHGEQEMSDWNGHYQYTGYHRCSCSTSSPTWNAASRVPATSCTALITGRVCLSWSSCGIREVLRIYFRADAAFGMPGVHACLEAKGVKYAIRIPINQVLQTRIAYLLTRPAGRPPNEFRRFCPNFSYQAEAGANRAG